MQSADFIMWRSETVQAKWTEVCDPSVHPRISGQVVHFVFDPELPGQTITRSEGLLCKFHSS